ncbi:DUF6638 family protein [uncultured Sulfitobacter sp.]|uniref:DUF6638 family protein n=1 Tax=uncultured Sulfitobacter sp. TaxID=191468 RepID=UPI00344F8787
MVERCNSALHHLTGHKTTLTDFYFDNSSYSPEIGEELDDLLYLNHKGVKRQCILLSMKQRTDPLLNTRFSTSKSTLRNADKLAEMVDTFRETGGTMTGSSST